MKNKKILFVSYNHNTDSVASQRAKALVDLLESKTIELDIVSKPPKFYKLAFLYEIFKKLAFGKFSHVYITCGPFFHLLWTAVFSKIFNKNLVVDIRDGWSINVLTEYGENIEQEGLSLKVKIKAKIAILAEKIAYACSYRFVTCTVGLKEYYTALFNNDKKVVLIENGYYFIPEKKSVFKLEKQIKFVCVGKFAEASVTKAKIVLEKIKLLIPTYDICLIFIGAEKKSNIKVLEDLNLLKFSKFLPRQKYNDAIKLIDESDIGLTIVRNENIEYGTKIFDYIGLGKPVFYLKDEENNFTKAFYNYLVDEQDILRNEFKISFDDNLKWHRYEIFRKFEGILF